MQLEGLIAYLVNTKDVRGKKALQKLVYFCSEAGVPMHARYRMYIYGPYSNEVAEELAEAITKEIVKAYDNVPRFSKGVCCNKYLELYKHEIESNSGKIDRVLEDFGDFSPLSGTVCHGTFYCRFYQTSLRSRGCCTGRCQKLKAKVYSGSNQEGL